jgi:hypothetical protein
MRLEGLGQFKNPVTSIFNSRIVSRISEIKIYKRMLKPDVIYKCRCETYCVTVKDKFVLNTWERKIPRKVYGPVTEEGVWRIGTDQEVWELYKTPELVGNIERRRLEWLGDAISMDQAAVAKKNF